MARNAWEEDEGESFVTADDDSDDEVYSSIKNDRVRQYMKDKRAADAGIDSAEKAQKNKGYIDAAESIGNSILEASRPSDRILANSWDRMGSKHDRIEAPEAKKLNLSPLRESLDSDLSSAQKKRERVSQDFDDGTELEKYERDTEKAEKQALFDDPTSTVSKQANLLLKQTLVAKAAEAEKAGDVDGANQIRAMISSDPLSANEAHSNYKLVKDIDYKDILNNMAADKRLSSQLGAQERAERRRDKKDELAAEKYASAQQQEKNKWEVTLQKEYKNHPDVDADRETQLQLNNAKAYMQQDDSKSDIALVYAYAKALDPRSVVREEEYNVYSNNPTVQGQIDGIMQKLVSGRIPKEERQKLFNTIQSRADVSARAAAPIRAQYREQARRTGADPDMITNPGAFMESYDIAPGAPEPSTSGQDPKIAAFAKANGVSYGTAEKTLNERAAKKAARSASNGK